mgnify:CR=1 FL=1
MGTRNSEASRQWMKERDERNALSRNHADHHGEPWTDGEIETLRERWDGRGEELLAEIAEELGRTIQACRQMYYCRSSARTPVRFKITRRWAVGFCVACGRFTDVCGDKCVDCGD